jgi:hypothetical protein
MEQIHVAEFFTIKEAVIMTKVSTTDTYRIPGIYEPIEYIVETHTVCDVCGSADISYKGNAHLSESTTLTFTLVIMVSFYGSILLGLITSNLEICGGLGIVSVASLMIYILLSNYVERDNNKEPRCNQCGNENIT